MTVLAHELKRGRAAFIIWTAAIAFLLAVCVLIFPDMKNEMQNMDEMFSSMGSLTEAFGLDRLDYGTFIGYYATECGNVLGLGGAFFAALCAVGILGKEEKEKTADFLLSHPVSRVRVITEKLIAVLIQVTALNIVVFAVSAVSAVAVGEDVPWKELSLLHLAYYIMQLELAGICFGISAFMRKGSVGAGLGIAALAYFLNIIANLTEKADFLKYVTPFAYCDGADIVSDCALDGGKIAIGCAIGVICVLAAYLKYSRKDIH
ncbi:MAG: ABC transporter permease subunit [Clostridia bacterium]|nr:ABC transporter permease subunit [Clostridia bacterium]